MRDGNGAAGSRERRTGGGTSTAPRSKASPSSGKNLQLCAALEYAKRGWRVFPLHAIRGGGSCDCGSADCDKPGKHPAIKNWPKEASTDPERIKEWWGKRPDRGIGIATGEHSGLTVLDVDGPEGVESLTALSKGHGGMPETPSVQTGKGGEHYHYYFKYNPTIKSKANALGSKLDTRSDGGYVVAPPSRHKSGEAYKWLQGPDKFALAEWPDFLSGKPKEGASAPTHETLNPHDPRQVDRLVSAVACVDPDDEEKWAHVGWILGRLFFQTDAGFAIYNAWAARSRKYDAKRTKGHYYQRSAASYSGDVKTTGSIFKWATEAGWKDAVQWAKPLNVFSDYTAPPLTVEDVPEVIGTYAVLHARAAGFDPTATIASAVAAAAACIDDGFRLCISKASDFYVSARLWIFLIGEPGAAKTPAERAMIDVIIAAHSKLVREQPPPDEKKKNKQGKGLFTSDTTVDALSDFLAENPRGVLAYMEELEAFLGSLDAYRSGTAGSKDRAQWIAAYDGGPYQVNRVTRSPILVRNWGVGILSATTPAALEKLSKHLPEDGLLQRFIPFSVGPTRKRDESILTDAAKASYDERLNALLTLTASEELSRNVVSMTPDARAAFEAAEDQLRQIQGAANAMASRFGSHVSKHVGMLARVVLIFHALKARTAAELTNEHVAESTVRLAARFMDKVFKHAMAIYTAVFSGGSSLELSRAIALSILASGLTDFNRTELTAVCHRIRGVQRREQDAALDWLGNMGWVNGNNPKWGERWTVNPQVHELFAKQAEAHRQLRETIRQKFKE